MGHSGRRACPITRNREGPDPRGRGRSGIMIEILKGPPPVPKEERIAALIEETGIRPVLAGVLRALLRRRLARGPDVGEMPVRLRRDIGLETEPGVRDFRNFLP